MGETKPDEAREKAREFLKAQGKDPDKLMPKVTPNPETNTAGAASSTEPKKDSEGNATEKEQQEQASRALAAEEAKKAEEAKRVEEDKKLLETDDNGLTDDQKARKKELLVLKETEKEAQRESRIQKRIDELVGQIKAEKAERDQDKQKIADLENQITQLSNSVERNPEKTQAEVQKLESERLRKYEQEDSVLPREKRREMKKADLEEWFLEDPVSAQEWMADRQLRRRDERNRDIEKLNRGSEDKDAKAKAEAIIKAQAESKARVALKHPDLEISQRVNALKAEGKNPQEIQNIIFKENPKVKILSEILKENPDKYMLSENGPELLAAEMEKRMSTNQGESEEEKDARLRAEGAEAERQRLASVDAGMRSTRGGSSTQEPERGPLYAKQLDIFRKAFPNLSEPEIKARLDKRLKAMGVIG